MKMIYLGGGGGKKKENENDVYDRCFTKKNHIGVP